MVNEEKIRSTYRKTGKLRETARLLGITKYQVEKACFIGNYATKHGHNNAGHRKGKLNIISEQKLLEKEDEFTRGMKEADFILGGLSEKEYVHDTELRAHCRIVTDSVWENIQKKHSGQIIVLGYNLKPQIYWGTPKSCAELVRKNTARWFSHD